MTDLDETQIEYPDGALSELIHDLGVYRYVYSVNVDNLIIKEYHFDLDGTFLELIERENPLMGITFGQTVRDFLDNLDPIQQVKVNNVLEYIANTDKDLVAILESLPEVLALLGGEDG